MNGLTIEQVEEVFLKTIERFLASPSHLCDLGGQGTGSPIEHRLSVALATMVNLRGGTYCNYPIDIQDVINHAGSNSGEYGLIAAPQVTIGEYRVDFALAMAVAADNVAVVVVECDGHDFHEKTKEQAARDKARDRALQSRGFHVLRYTGSEIWRDAAKCAEEIADVIYDRWFDRHYAAHHKGAA